MNYRAVLRHLHARLRPQTYLEIGVKRGLSLGLSQAPHTIGIDPKPHADANALLNRPGVALYTLTSDAFFAEHSRESVLQGATIDLAFIDGLHQFDQVVRDFVNVERWCSPSGVVIIHDVIPPSEAAASRDHDPGPWSGDVWQMVPCLRDYRPDLDFLLVRTPPSGLLIVRNLNPLSDVLTTSMERILRSVPEDGEPYMTAVREYLATASAVSPREALNRLFGPNTEVVKPQRRRL
jgi:hypothetical protein